MISSHRFNIETVTEGVGRLAPEERNAIQQILGADAGVYLDRFTNQLHFSWNLTVDTMDEAIDLGRSVHHSAKNATGVFVPRTSLFVVREVADST